MTVSTMHSRRSKHLRRNHADRRRQGRVSSTVERRRTGGRRDTEIDNTHFAYNGA